MSFFQQSRDTVVSRDKFTIYSIYSISSRYNIRYTIKFVMSNYTQCKFLIIPILLLLLFNMLLIELKQ